MTLTREEKEELLAALLARHFFDPAWYIYVNTDVRAAGVDPEAHFRDYGIDEQRSPHPLFSAAFYLDTNPALRTDGIHPLWHYVFEGAARGLTPHPLVAPRWLAARLPEAETPLFALLADSTDLGPRPLFDIPWLRRTLGLAADSPAREVLTAYFCQPPATRPGPCALVDPDFIRRNADLSDSADPTVAYLNGAAGALSPHPLFDRDFTFANNDFLRVPYDGLSQLEVALTAPARRRLTTSPLFDVAHYQTQLGSAEDTGTEPLLLHYLQEGFRQGHDPNPYFDEDLYRARYLAGEPETNPLLHYLRNHREPHITLSPRFPDRFYVMRYPEVRRDFSRSPLEHYLMHGRKEGRRIGTAPWADDFASWDCLRADVRAGAACLDVQTPEVSVIIPVYNQFQFTLRSVWSILRAGDAARVQIIIADDGSDDETEAFFGPLAHLSYRRNPANLGFLKSCNAAVATARAPYLFFLNNDTAVLPGWIDRLLETARALPEAGLVGSKLIYPDGILQEAGGYIWRDGTGANFGRDADPDHPGFNFRRDADYVSGAAILVPRKAWDQAGGFDEHYAPAYCEDADLAIRLRNLGWRVIYQPMSEVVHFEGVSSGTSVDSGIKAYQPVNQEKMLKKWAFTLEGHAPNHAPDPESPPRPPRPRLLIIDAEVPDPAKDAGSVVVLWYLRLLSGIGYDITFAAENLQLNGTVGRNLQALGIRVLQTPYARSLDDWLTSHAAEFDLFMLYRHNAGGRYIEQIRDLCPQTPIIFNTVDLHYLREERAARQGGSSELLAAAAKTRARELAVIEKATETILLSSAEITLLRKDRVPGSFSLIPLVMEPAAEVAPRKGRSGIGFVGGYRHPPNVDAVLAFVQDVWPLLHADLPDLELHIVGSHPPPEILAIDAPGVTVVGYVEDLDGFLAARIATIAPLRYGAGIKGKIVSSLAAGVPCVSTSVGVEGMGLVDGRDLLIADSPQDFADAVARLCSDSELWDQLSAAGRAAVAANYAPEVIRDQLLRLLAKVGAAPFTGLCPISGKAEARRFQHDNRPGSLASSPTAPMSGERVAAAALATLAGMPGQAILRLAPGALTGVALPDAMPTLAAALKPSGALAADGATRIAVLAEPLDPQTATRVLAAAAALPATCTRLVLVCEPVGVALGQVRQDPDLLAPIVQGLEAAGWQVRLDPLALSECALTGVVLVEARR